ncbi:MAG: CHAT domain-containing protein, partial [Steroidobacteraceae bacterium]
VHVGSIGDAQTYLDRAATFSCSRLLAVSSSPAKPSADALDGEHEAGSPAPASPAAACAETPTSGATLNGDIAVFEALLSMSEIARLDGQLSAAATCLGSARRYSVDARTQIRLVNASAALASELGHPRRAAAEFHLALELSRTAALTEATQFAGVSELGLAAAELDTGADAEATRHASAALRLSSRRADMTQIIASLRTLGAAYAAAGKRALAIRTLRAAIGLIEQFPTGELDAARRATYLATQHGVFAELMDLLAVGAAERGSEASWSAFAVAERGHARSLRYALEQAARERAAREQSAHERAAGPETGPRTARGPATSTTRYGSLLRTLAAAARQAGPKPSVSASSGEAGNGRGQESGAPRAGTGEPPPAPLLRRIIELAAPTAGAAPPVDRGALAAKLRSTNAVLVEYAAGREAMFAFVTDGATMHVTRLASRASIARAAASLAERLRAPEEVPDEIRAAAKQLAALVLWPIRSQLTRPRVIFVPAGALHTSPFAVLPWSAATSSSLVLQHLEISTVPSALLLTRRAAPPPHASGGERFVLLGDPVLRDTIWYRTCSGLAARERVPQAIRAAFAWSRSLPMLPGSRAEVLGIARIARRWRPSAGIETLLGCEATPAALRRAAPAATVLHIATHGLVDAHRPRLSALALTPDPPSASDAEFRLLDIMGLPLQARIVVLSACDTSRGRLLPGEGVLGLAQAFLQAGSGSVVASYWRVSDAATVPFMKTFYRYLLRDRLPVGEALRRTQLDLARSGSYGWAAFSLYGEPDSRA